MGRRLRVARDERRFKYIDQDSKGNQGGSPAFAFCVRAYAIRRLVTGQTSSSVAGQRFSQFQRADSAVGVERVLHQHRVAPRLFKLLHTPQCGLAIGAALHLLYV